MLEAIKYTTIRDICITDFIVYDKEKTEALAEFCMRHGISFIPDRNRKSYWRLDGNKFTHIQELSPHVIIGPEELIFDETTINKFKNRNYDEVMFVVEDRLIKGVVHIVDYNNDNLYVELYRMLLSFENNLRNLLIQKKHSNEDFLNWLKKEGEKNYYYKNMYEQEVDDRAVQRRKNANPFQTFYLKDLMNFAQAEKLLNLSHSELNDITELRNWVAHSKDVTTVKPDSDHPVYNITGLVKFIELSTSFFKSYESLELVLEEFQPANFSILRKAIKNIE